MFQNATRGCWVDKNEIDRVAEFKKRKSAVTALISKTKINNKLCGTKIRCSHGVFNRGYSSAICSIDKLTFDRDDYNLYLDAYIVDNLDKHIAENSLRRWHIVNLKKFETSLDNRISSANIDKFIEETGIYGELEEAFRNFIFELDYIYADIFCETNEEAMSLKNSLDEIKSKTT